MLLGHVRSQDQDGPPPWVPFGRRIQPLNIVDGQDKKTLEENEKVVKDEEFLSQRQDAIAAAADTSGVTKVIKGSGRQVIRLCSLTIFDRFYYNNDFMSFILAGNATNREKRSWARAS